MRKCFIVWQQLKQVAAIYNANALANVIVACNNAVLNAIIQRQQFFHRMVTCSEYAEHVPNGK